MREASLALEFVSIAWKSAKVVIIPKTRKKNYMAPKSFKSISLASFLFKSLERIVDRYLLEGILVTQLFHNNHKHEAREIKRNRAPSYSA